jgi:hypothetical protein
MKSCEAYVTTAIREPYQIYQDSSNLQKKVIYKPFILPKPYDRQYLRVVMEYHKKKKVAYICTAFPCVNKKKGDILIWEKS